MRHHTFRIGKVLVRVLVLAMLSGCVSLTNETPLEVPRADNNLYDITLMVHRWPLAQSVERPVVTADGTEHEMIGIGNGRWRYEHQVPLTRNQFEYRFAVAYTIAPIPGIYLFTNQGIELLPHSRQAIVTDIQGGLVVDVVPVLSGPDTTFSDVTLTWTYLWPGGLGSNLDGYELEESTSSPSAGFAPVAFFAGRNSPEQTTLIRPPGTYWYRVRARNNLQLSGWSSVHQVNVVQETPAAIRVINNLTGGGSDRALRLRIATTEGQLYSGQGPERLSPDNYCDSLPGLDVPPNGGTRTIDLGGVVPDYLVFIGLGLWDIDPPSCPNGFSKKMWTTDANFNLLYIWVSIQITGHTAGTADVELTYDASNNIVARIFGSDIPFGVSVNFDPIGP